jgi:PqqD family protein of HPr-rel-A system
VPADELQSVQWGDDVVLHHRASGLTHFVNLATAVLLRNVLAGPRTLDAAAHTLADAENAQADEGFVAEVVELIQRLEALGLVERVAA